MCSLSFHPSTSMAYGSSAFGGNKRSNVNQYLLDHYQCMEVNTLTIILVNTDYEYVNRFWDINVVLILYFSISIFIRIYRSNMSDSLHI